ncbi:UbiD family decarboxylase domain-containing protein, partial [Chloroflexota bacterium]
IAIGMDPISTMCAANPVPYGVPEVEIAGAIRGGPVELVKCETVDLEVPATAEIVIEGEVRPGDLMDEGPFGEYTGYVGGHRAPRQVVRVKAVTHRNNPIFTMSCVGVPVGDDHALQAVTRSAGFLEALKAEGVPVIGAYVPPEAITYMVVVSIKSPAGRADQVAHTVWASRAGGMTPYVIVVDEDVNPFDMSQVIHALVTRCHPLRGIHSMEGSTFSALVPWLTRHEQQYLIGAKVYFDCTWPVDWGPEEIPTKCAFDTIYNAEIQKKALDVWQKYGH